jgi:hypothetical protein
MKILLYFCGVENDITCQSHYHGAAQAAFFIKTLKNHCLKPLFYLFYKLDN